MKKINIYIENDYKIWEPDIQQIKDYSIKIFEYYSQKEEILQNWCLKGIEYSSITFDYFLCDGVKSHQINKEYRQKDYVADIITFAIFADSPQEERFVLVSLNASVYWVFPSATLLLSI